MKLFLKYLITVIAITGIASASFYFIVNVGLRKQKCDVFGKLNELILGNENFDIIFIGSSRVNLTINPEIIDSVVGCNSFNFGLDAANIVDYEMHLKTYLRSHPRPKLLVLNIDPKMFDIGNEIKFPARYLPYIDHPEIYDTLQCYSTLAKAAKYMPFIASSFYSDDMLNQSLQAFISPHRKMLNYYKGFSPLSKSWNRGDITSKDLLTISYTSKGLGLFKNFLKNIKKYNLPLQLIYAPQYFIPPNNSAHKAYITRLNALIADNDYSIVDYSTMELCKNKKYFFDATHLNVVGASVFSEKLSYDLKKVVHK